jgi:NitT/TauT family transport system ATP-binding protein
VVKDVGSSLLYSSTGEEVTIPIYERKETLLKIDNVSVSYDGIPVLRGMSAEIKNVVRPGMAQGQVVALLGPSGIGKTTLFKVLAGLKKPDKGSVLVGVDQRITAPGTVGVVAQNYPLLNHRTVMGNLIIAAEQATEYSHTTDAVSRSTNMLTEFGLTEHAEKYPIQLSGGQRQRVAIAQQLLCSEHYIVMDEPFSGLDVNSLNKVLTLIQKVTTVHEETTVIVVTHDVSAAVAVADTVWLMGRERDVQSNVIPGARIMETLDLIELGVCWQDNAVQVPEAIQLIQDIKKRFATL